MATLNDEIYVKIIADASTAINGIKSLAAAFAAAWASVKIFREVIGGSLKSYLESENSIQRLNAALRITGQYSDITARKLDNLAGYLQKTTVYSDEAARGAEAMLLQLGDLSVEGVQKMLPLVADFAASMGIDLVQAAELVGKSIGGTTNMLGRYGIQIKDAIDPNQRFSQIIEQLAGKFGGMSKSLAETTGGQLEMFKNQLDELKESIGGVVATMLNPILKNWLQGFRVNDIMKVDPKTITDLNILQSMFDTMTKQLKEFADMKDSPYSQERKWYKEFNDQTRAIWDQIQALKALAKTTGDVSKPMVNPPNVAANIISPLFQNQQAFLNAGQPTNMDMMAALRVTETIAATDEVASNIQDITNATWNQVEATKGLPDAWDIYQSKIEDTEALFNQIAAIGQSIGESLAAGDTEGAFKKIADSALSAIIAFATAAAAKAYVLGDPSWVMWAGIAGLGILGEIGIGAAGSSSASGGGSTLPHSIAGGKSITINVAGSVLTERNLARTVAAAQRDW